MLQDKGDPPNPTVHHSKVLVTISDTHSSLLYNTIKI